MPIAVLPPPAARYECRSLPHLPEALISNTTSPGPGVGSGNSRSSNRRSPRNTTPRISSPYDDHCAQRGLSLCLAIIRYTPAEHKRCQRISAAALCLQSAGGMPMLLPQHMLAVVPSELL